MTVKIALIGAGVMGADHAWTLATQVPRASLHTICDADGERARGLAAELEVGQVFTDPLAAIADKGVEAGLKSLARGRSERVELIDKPPLHQSLDVA